MRSLIGVFFAFLFFVPSVFAQTIPQFGGSWTFQMSVDIYNPSDQYVRTLTVTSLPVTLPATTQPTAAYISRAGIVGAGPNSFVEFRMHPNQPGTLEVIICYFGPMQYIGELTFGGVTATRINQREAFSGQIVVRVVNPTTGFHSDTGGGRVYLLPN